MSMTHSPAYAPQPFGQHDALALGMVRLRTRTDGKAFALRNILLVDSLDSLCCQLQQHDT
jgi:hypothetical protein